MRGGGAYWMLLLLQVGIARGFLALPATVGQVARAFHQDPLFPSRDSLTGQCPQVDIKVNDQDVW